MPSPRLHRDPHQVELKLGRLEEHHVAPLTRYVEALRGERPEGAIPYFDPEEAGTRARVLLLLEAPGRRAALDGGSGFVSADNNDQTAANMWMLLREAGIDRAREITTWNVVPWYIGDGQRIRAARGDDLNAGRRAVEGLLGLLLDLRAVVLLGRKAQASWRRMRIKPLLHLTECPHPSPLSINTTPGARGEILAALEEAKRIAGDGPAMSRPI